MRNLLVLLISVIIFWGCSSSQQSTSEEQGNSEKIYVFDDVSDVSDSVDINTTKDTLILKQNTPKLTVNNFIYYVQVGAFTSEERAQRFVLFNKDKTTYPLNVSFNNDLQLWVVRLPKFDTKEEAEKVRDELWQTDSFKDAFIVTVSK